MIFEAHGPLGTGKTMIVVNRSLRHWFDYKCELQIISNVPLGFGIPYVPLRELVQLYDLNDACVIIFDEMWHKANSRKSGSPENDVLSTLSLRARKKDWFFGYTQQHWMQTDKRVRYVTDFWYEPCYYLGADVLVVDVYSLEGVLLDQQVYDGRAMFGVYDTKADPLTLDIENSKREYMMYCRRKYGVSYELRVAEIMREAVEREGQQVLFDYRAWAAAHGCRV